MSMGFIKHVLAYFYADDPSTTSPPTPIFVQNPDTPTNTSPPLLSATPSSACPLPNNLVPVYNIDGRVLAYTVPLLPHGNVNGLDTTPSPGLQLDSISTNLTSSTAQLLSTVFPASLQPVASATTPQPVASATTPAPSHQQGTPEAAFSASETKWSNWPDGDFLRLFTHEEYQRTKQFMVHWACVSRGGHAVGSRLASRWEDGAQLVRRCLGVFVCDGERCHNTLRPKTRPEERERQKKELCLLCDLPFRYVPCTATQVIWTYADGYMFQHVGHHRHPRPGQQLHLSQQEQDALAERVRTHPKAGPLALIVGSSGMVGGNGPITDISPILANKSRVKKERQKINRESTLNTDKFQAIVQYCRDNKDWVLDGATFCPVTVISMQTAMMRRQLTKGHIDNENVNGLVSDAAHGFWRERNYLLIVSSCYSLELHCWVPALVSYSDGASAAHYKAHFYTLFKSIAQQASQDNVPLADHLFSGVVDFSEAERRGFIDAFVQFWQNQDGDYRTADTLRQCAINLLRGCRQHFRAGIRRVKAMHAVVPPERAEEFHHLAEALLHAPTVEEFYAIADNLIASFPRAQRWLSWWLEEAHASMLFDSQRKMDPFIWDSRPDTTNAEEAMHWKLYMGVGRDQDVLPGLQALQDFAKYYDTLLATVHVGGRIEYGAPEPWKKKKAEIGRTKAFRTPQNRFKNDGRPPDTSRELVLRQSQSKPGEPSAAPLRSPKVPANDQTSVESDLHPSYLWSQNSCWLDVALEMIFQTVQRDFKSFSASLSRVICHAQTDSASHNGPHAQSNLHKALLTRLFNDMQVRGTLTSNSDTGEPQILQLQRNTFRELLYTANIVQSLDGYDSVFGWLGAILRGILKIIGFPSTPSPASYFQGFIVRLRTCTGVESQHFQLRSEPECSMYFLLDSAENSACRGKLAIWLRRLTSIGDCLPVQLPCWHTQDGTPLCQGVSDEKRFVLQLPVMLTLEVEPESDVPSSTPWDFPQHLFPTKQKNPGDGVVYDIVGRILFNRETQHFVARFVDYRGPCIIADYDSMVHGGWTTHRKPSTLKTTLVGDDAVLPSGYETHAVIYHLRGGLDAQRTFFEQQKAAMWSLHHIYVGEFDEETGQLPDIELRRTRTTRTADNSRIWMQNPQSSKRIDYHELPPPTGKSNRKVKNPGPPKPKISKAKTTTKAALSNPATHATPTELPALATSDIAVPPAAELPASALPAPAEHHSELDVFEPPPLADDSRLPSDHAKSPSIAMSDCRLECRCGSKGDNAYALYAVTGSQQIIKCKECKKWSHIACQALGRAGCLRPSEAFYCDSCSGAAPLRAKPTRKSQRSTTNDTVNNSSVRDRLWAGKGALARHGEFWYPVRLIKFSKSPHHAWRVVWWRGCEFPEGVAPPVPNNLVLEADLVDELWHDHLRRRQIRLGKWQHACETDSEEDIILKYVNYPYTEEIEGALRPCINDLQGLLQTAQDPDALVNYASRIPVVGYLFQTHKREATKSGIVHHCGDLSLVDEAQIANWFARHVEGAAQTAIQWLGRYPLSHAFTLVIKARHRTEFMALFDFPQTATPEVQEQWLLAKAWRYQLDNVRDFGNVDVDRECLYALEDRMFEKSKAAGVAGNYQWGLDKGSHQSWDPWAGLMEGWNHGDREGHESELEQGPEFVEIPRVATVPQKRPAHIKPRPLFKRARKE